MLCMVKMVEKMVKIKKKMWLINYLKKIYRLVKNKNYCDLQAYLWLAHMWLTPISSILYLIQLHMCPTCLSLHSTPTQQASMYMKDIWCRFPPLVWDWHRIVGPPPKLAGHDGFHLHWVCVLNKCSSDKSDNEMVSIFWCFVLLHKCAVTQKQGKSAEDKKGIQLPCLWLLI